MNERKPGAIGGVDRAPPTSAPVGVPGSSARPETGQGSGVDLLPALVAPRGGGAIRGIAEKFSASAATGTGTLSVPIAVSPGRASFQPQLTLDYDTGNGNSAYGIGWRLSLQAITRKSDKGLPRFADEARQADDGQIDVFILSGAEDLVPVRVPVPGGKGTQLDIVDQGEHRVQRYRPRVEGMFARIERWTQKTTGDVHWRAVTRDNQLSIFGQSAQARIAAPERPGHVFSWLLEEVRDDRGNVARYTYKAEDGVGVDPGQLSEASRFAGSAAAPGRFMATAQRYPKRIQYGNRLPVRRDQLAPTAPDAWLFEVVFDYGEHDVAAATPAEMTPWPVRADPFSTYRATFEVRTYRLCHRVLMFHRFAELGAAPVLVRSTDLIFEEGPVVTYLTAITHAGYLPDAATGGYERAARPSTDLGYSRPVVHDELRTIDRESLEGIQGGVDGARASWVDLDGEGIPGVLIPTERAWYYKVNQGQGRLGPPALQRTLPSPAELRGGMQQLTDLGGDGKLDLVRYAPPLSGFFERTPEGAFAPFLSMSSIPNINWNGPNLRFLDADGDGLPDVLISENDTFVWYRSRGKAGFEPGSIVSHAKDEAEGPAVIFADGSETIQLADMSGDGLVDIVRVRDGEVCYWPNLGYGRFGRRVTLNRSPRFDLPGQFDPRRVRFADIDGSGTSDIVYLGREGARLYFNQSGNGFSAPVPVRSLPTVDSLSSLTVTDLLGQGTACLVWSTTLPDQSARRVMFVDLMGGKKPHLLDSITNNLGAETRIAYAPSTRFYLADKAAGRPWLTRLPFPVHVVERMERVDLVAKTRLVTRYSYHHGYFDGVEREFRGFARVETFDAESFSGDRGIGLFPESAVAGDPLLRVPPVHTKTWFHTGAFLERERLEVGLAAEYYKGDPAAPLLPDTLVPAGLSPREEREAARALRGRILRQEVYSDDGTALSGAPFLTSERSYQVRLVQHREGSAFGVFFVHPRETVERRYERNPADPRMTHDLVLAVDEFGNVTRSASLAYPRRQPVEPEQGRLWATVSDRTFANRPDETDFYRIGVPVEAITSELTGVTVPAAGGVLDRDGVGTAIARAVEIPFDAIADGPGPQRRVFERTRMLYYGEDLSDTPLPLGQIGSLALPFETRRATFTPGLLAATYGALLSPTALAALLEDEGRYLREDGIWWTRSGRAVFDPSQFFQPVSAVDPFGKVSNVVYDGYRLFAIEAADAFDNVTFAVHSYRVLQPELVTDQNGNRVAVAFDALGMVVRTAQMGKAGAGEGDTLEQPTTRLEYDLLRWQRGEPTGGRKPAFAHTIARERHGDPDSPLQHSYSYSDGSGHEILKKIQAEPGAAPAGSTDGSPRRNPDGSLTSTHAAARWVGTGRTVFDDKGNPVKKYEPFFSSTFEFEDEDELVQSGVTPILHYDPFARLVRTELPDGTETRVVFDAWTRESWDQNDTLEDRGGLPWLTVRLALAPGDPERRAAELARQHAGTPAVEHLDAMGRVFLNVLDNGPAGKLPTRTELDVAGNRLSLTDARGVRVDHETVDMLTRSIATDSADSGARVVLADVTGKPLRRWDARGQVFRYRYDDLRRQTHLFVKQGEAAERLLLRTVYGEQLDERGTARDPAHPSAAQQQNLRGQPYQLYDCAGLVTNATFDFKGNLLQSERRLAVDYLNEPDWIAAEAVVEPGDILARSEALLETERFETRNSYDALNRVTALTTRDGSVQRPTYNEAGLMEQLHVSVRGGVPALVIGNIDYNARGQRTRCTYANPLVASADADAVGTVRIDYTYDPLTFRLADLLTTRGTGAGVVALQHLLYTYDAFGNVVAVRDQATTAPIFLGAPVSGDGLYEYDAVYRLVRAEGREHPGQTGVPTQPGPFDRAPAPFPHPNDLQALVRYREDYSYDPAGNIERVAHRTVTASGSTGPAWTQWTRRYRYATDSNRLLATSLPGDPDGVFGDSAYDPDPHGSMTRMPHLALMEWDYADRLRHTRRANGADPQDTYFTYDGAGQRVRKVFVHSGLIEERIYVGGFEVFRRHLSAVTMSPAFQRETLHVADNEHRVAMVETTTADALGVGGTSRWRFQLESHIGSVLLELDEVGDVISYEEYHPYGSTAFYTARGGAEVSAKRYRYVGKERDEETGLYYYGARYYAPWLGRWTAADPGGVVDGPNLFVYVRNRPTALTDPNGQGAWDHILGGVKAVGGALETAAGVGLIGVGAATSEFGIGVLIIAAGVAVTAHGADTTIAGARQAVSGEQTDTLTSTGLQAAGLSRRNANLVDAGISIVGTFGAGAATRAAPAATEGLVHLTTAEGATAINAAQTLGKGGTVYAGSASLADASGTAIFLKTGLLPSQATNAIAIPEAAATAFRVPTVIGPATAWQRLSGTVYTAGAGSIDLTTGVFTRIGPATNQLFFYGFDATVVAAAKTSPEIAGLVVDVLSPASPQSATTIPLGDASLASVVPGAPNVGNDTSRLPFALAAPSNATFAPAPDIIAPTPAEEEAQQSLLPEFR